MSRLPSHILVSALIRRADQEGGSAAILARGDRESGTLLVVCRTRGAVQTVLESGRDLDGRAVMREIGPAESADERALADWIARRRKTDPDLWVIDLDVADAQRFTAETIAAN